MGISGGFVSGHRFSDALRSSKSKAPLGAGLAIILALIFSTYTLADSGSDTYKTKCSACHGANGAGDTMLGKNLKLRPLASADVQKESDDELATIIGKGRNRMPPFNAKLSKDQIRDVVNHIRSLKK
ncbi:MAG: cytochrome c [Terriglobales bacterium]